MVYTKSWAVFQSQCLELYAESPSTTRYLIKAHPATQWLTLKVTDDKKVLKFKTRSAAILNRLEAFNKDLAASMVGLRLPSQIQAEAEAEAARAAAAASSSNADAMDVDAEGGKAGAKAGGKGGAGSAAAAGASGTGTGTGAAGGGGKKKKKKGKK
ncbi:unnamed protein product [Tilletia controversa]|uniref:SRP9 domain-containing protein n=1 Tax=Tilletia controversa TaxID=13291 RepID=A0A8X7SZB3_9BASI|nr:hypothetical protein A4X06_0g2229 [Tilletia controversa]CAD6913281.1 unnamed protein product [Tilletia controversa]CAD6942844.1 unnamed protein product [Tilletia controversa]CAD6967832.1 unnamed protein product [Tilletia controversa]